MCVSIGVLVIKSKMPFCWTHFVRKNNFRICNVIYIDNIWMTCKLLNYLKRIYVADKNSCLKIILQWHRGTPQLLLTNKVKFCACLCVNTSAHVARDEATQKSMFWLCSSFRTTITILSWDDKCRGNKKHNQVGTFIYLILHVCDVQLLQQNGNNL